MSYIVMCGNSGECQFKDRCIRHTTPPSERQSWSGFYTPGEKCGHFMGGYPYARKPEAE